MIKVEQAPWSLTPWEGTSTVEFCVSGCAETTAGDESVTGPADEKAGE